MSLLTALLLCQLAAAQDQPPADIRSGDEVSAQEVPADGESPSPAATTTSVRLVTSGGSGGIGSGSYRFSLAERVAGHLASQNGVQALVPYHGALAQGPFALLAADGRVATLLDLVGGEVTCTEPARGSALQTGTEWLVVPGVTPPPEWLVQIAQPGNPEPVAVRRCSGSGSEALLVAPDGHGEDPDWALQAWEFRLALRGEIAVEDTPIDAHFIGIPADEASRRVALLERLLSEHPDARFVDTGAFVDGTSSVRDGALSLHRPVGFSVLDRLDPLALAPGRTELAGGARVFLAEAAAADLPYVATNWETEDPELSLPDVLLQEVETDGGTVRVAFLGIVDPIVHTQAPQLAVDGVTLTDPVPAARAAIDALATGSTPPDAVVVLTTAGPALMDTLRTELHGAHVLLGDTGAETDRLATLEATLRLDGGTGPANPVTLPVDGIAIVELGLAREGDGWSLASTVVQPQPVPGELPLDADVRERIGETRATEYPPLDHPLLPASQASPNAPIDQATWEKLVCEAVREYTDADAVFLPELAAGAPIPGPLTELLAVDRLAMLDTIEVHRVPGDRMERLLFKSYGLVPVHCGAPLGQRWPKARGRYIEDERVYRIASTDRARTATDIGGLLKEAYSPWALDKPGHKPVLGPDGEPVTLRTAVLGTLRSLRDDPEVDDLVTELADRSASDRPPMWLLRVRALSARVERFQGTENDAYANIPETLATSPSSLTLGGDLDVALDYSSSHLLWDLRLRSKYTSLSTADEAGQETADDLKPSTSVSLPGAAIPVPKFLDLMPYGEVFLDSEITPIESDGDTLARQADLWFTVGLSAKRKGIVRALRLAGFGLRDLSTPDKAMEFGARLEWETRYVFGPGLKWTSECDASVYGNTPDQDDSDLRFRALLDTAIALPLARYLDISVYGQGFLFQGRVPATSDLGAAWTIGFSLDVSGAFEL
jgi:hypothetical protein